MKILGKNAKKVLAACLATSLVLASGGAVVASIADSDIRDNFVFPQLLVKSGTVGVKTEIARITPADTFAEEYMYTVVDETGKQIPTDGYSFFPEKAGKYKCVYHYKAGGKTYEYSYVVNVTVKDGPVFNATPSFPNAFIAGKSYKLPQVTAADWSGGSAQSATVTTEVFVGGQQMAVTDNSVTILSEGTSDAIIRYTATVGNKTEIYETGVPVMDVYKTVGTQEIVDTTSLFVMRGFDEVKAYTQPDALGNPSPAGVEFSTLGDAEAKFANLLGSHGTNVTFGFGTACAAQSIVYKIESYEDPSVCLTLEFRKGTAEEGRGTVILNGGLSKYYTFTKEGKISVKYDEMKKRFLDAENKVIFDVDKDLNGGAFTGFPGGRTKISFEVKDCFGATDLRVYEINNQTLGVNADTLNPSVFVENVTVEYFAGEEITLFNRFAVDVIDPNATVWTTITCDGQDVLDINGKAIKNVINDAEVKFIPEKAGSYLVRGITRDASGATANYTRLLYVFDKVKPTVTVDGEVAKTAAKGGKITLPAATAADNDDTAKTTVQLLVMWPSARMIQLNAGQGQVEATEFAEFDDIGVYTFRYVATDEYGNMDVKEYHVVCGG